MPPSVTLGYRAMRSTEMAIRFEGEASFWAPRSVIREVDTRNRLVTIDGWFARKNGLA